MIETSVVETIAGRIEQELARVRAARPSLASRISRAENIVTVHLSCRRARIIRVRANTVHGARFLVSGSKGAVYVVDPGSWSCTCPDAHRHGKGCKHALACWALWRASARPAHRVEVAEVVPVEALVAERSLAEESGSYEVRECSRCFDGLVYDGESGVWVDHERCSGTGRARVFVYPKARRLRGCASCGGRFSGRDLFAVGEDHMTFFEGDELCRCCANRHGVL